MVGFEIESLGPVAESLMAEPVTIDAAPYDGRRVGVLRGPAGELLELIESD